MKILPVGANLSHAEGRTDKQTDITKLIFAFRYLTKVPKSLVLAGPRLWAGQCPHFRHALYSIVWTKLGNAWKQTGIYEKLPKISENLNIPRKPLALRTCAARYLLLYLSAVSQPTGVFIRAHVSEFWLLSLHRFHVCLLLSKWWILRSKEFALNFVSGSTKLQLRPTEC